jgi:uncharacterized protein (DUF433 family)
MSKIARRFDSMTTIQTTYKHIVRTPEIVGGKPRIAGRRITVQNVVIWHEQMGYSIEEIASLYNLTLAEVHSALAYYFDNKAEIDRSIAESEAYTEELRQKTPSLLAQRLYERTR